MAFKEKGNIDSLLKSRLPTTTPKLPKETKKNSNYESETDLSVVVFFVTMGILFLLWLNAIITNYQ